MRSTALVLSASNQPWEGRGPEPAVGAPSSYKWKEQLRKSRTEPAAEEEGVEGGTTIV